MSALPIEAALPALKQALQNGPNAVLVAPPGAGKTTCVPLALLDEGWVKDGRIIMLEPRRIAARAAAARMAELLSENVGQTVGHRMRFDTKIGPKTRIEVVTDGVFTRLLAENPGLDGVAAVIFDEFHERSLDGDLGLALCRDLQLGLREDLRLLPMSATLDGAKVAQLLDAPVVESEGRAFPVTIDHDPRPGDIAIEPHTARAVRRILNERDGDILVFLPGQKEIEKTTKLLTNLPENVTVHRLYGAVSRAEQDEAVRPAKPGCQKVILASAIAETSLTINGVKTVIDSGLARLPQFEPATGLTRLATLRASRAAAEQRAGRAGRTGPGHALRLWHPGQTASMAAFDPPAIEVSDLSALCLDLIDWGISDPGALAWLTPPPEPAMNEARALLFKLGLLDEKNRLTRLGTTARTLPLPPRLGAMVARANNPEKAALLALILQERGPGGQSADLDIRLEQAERDSGKTAQHLRQQAKRMVRHLHKDKSNTEETPGLWLSHAFPDRIAKRGATAPDGTVRYRLVNGRGAHLQASDLLAKEQWLVVADLIGKAGAARIIAAAQISLENIQAHHEADIANTVETRFDITKKRLSATRSRKLGALTLQAPERVELDDESALDGLLQAVREHGLDLLPWSEKTRALRARLDMVADHALPTDQELLDSLEDWLAPYLTGLRDFASLPLADALMALAGYPSQTLLNQMAPAQFTTPAGTHHSIDYSGNIPSVSVRPQELFGLDVHPMIGSKPLELHLVSPAGRPVQITQDLPGFWRGSWADVRADLRGRYPKHPWPENPLSAEPTARAKPRKR